MELLLLLFAQAQDRFKTRYKKRYLSKLIRGDPSLEHISLHIAMSSNDFDIDLSEDSSDDDDDMLLSHKPIFTKKHKKEVTTNERPVDDRKPAAVTSSSSEASTSTSSEDPPPVLSSVAGAGAPPAAVSVPETKPSALPRVPSSSAAVRPSYSCSLGTCLIPVVPIPPFSQYVGKPLRLSETVCET